MNEYVYATDIETHEIVYMNRKTLQAYGLQSLEDAKGKKCYEILQKTLIPCGMCNNDRLSVGEFEEWHYYNPSDVKGYVDRGLFQWEKISC